MDNFNKSLQKGSHKEGKVSTIYKFQPKIGLDECNLVVTF
jgi:hypothetical protein